jgi:hypothetical protein
MSLNLDVAEVWDALRSHIDFNDREDAADTLINLLIDNNHEASSIKEAFRGDKEILNALKNYTDAHDSEEYEDYDEEDQDDEWD